MTDDLSIAIVVPVLNEASGLAATLAPLQPMRSPTVRLIVVDGGSTDATSAIARPLCDALVFAPRGRASQMNAGAAASDADILLFLHADTRLPADALSAIRTALADLDRHWGRFDVTIEGHHPLFPVIAAAMNARTRIEGMATGDMGIFLRRATFEAVGGFPDIPLMEDIALAKTLRRISRPACLRQLVTTSGRRWDSYGVGGTVLTMWRLRAAYALGADPWKLARRYGYAPRPRTDGTM